MYFQKKDSSHFISEVRPDGAEGLWGALRLSSCSHHVSKPGASAVIPPVWDVICGREHERRGLGSLLPSHLPLLPSSCIWIYRQVLLRYVHEHINTYCTCIIVFFMQLSMQLIVLYYFCILQAYLLLESTNMKDSTITTQVNTRWAMTQWLRNKLNLYAPFQTNSTTVKLNQTIEDTKHRYNTIYHNKMA